MDRHPRGDDSVRDVNPGGDPPIRVLAAVIRRGEELLVCQRPHHKRHGGQWEFPGGKRENGESDEEALSRELREELGLAVVAVGVPEFERRDDGSPFLIVFIPVAVIGEPVAHEHVAIRWGTLDLIAGLPLAPTDRHFLDHLRRCGGRRPAPPT